MICKLLEIKGNWKSILNACRTTVNKGEVDKEPSSDWKRKLLLSEHSPIRKLIICAKWENLKYFIHTHLARHWVGILHFVSTSRDDRVKDGLLRKNRSQEELVNHEIEVNAQAIINISRKRLCNMSDIKTIEAWKEFLNQIKDKEPELYSVCVPDCVYRGHCFELNSCGYYRTEEYWDKLFEYRKGVNDGQIPETYGNM